MQATFHYQVSTPTNMETGKTYPVLFALHGIGHNEKRMLEVFEGVKEKYILIGIRGQLTYENGYAFYYLKSYGNPERRLFDESMERLQSFIEYACNKYPVDRERVHIGGFSQGAILANSLALVLGETLKGIVSMNGYIPSFVPEDYPTKPIHHLSIFLSDGEFDQIFPPEVGKKNYEHFRNSGAAVIYKTYSTDHRIIEENKSDLTKWLLA
ncbi:alpha/beta hydrolase [Bacillus sp. Marseille-P3661]|uniref:alpha/beta hydrolase n=1 Tax=Bacillus sp. Marseille-P3661 TaxID=1936234 RepID=UPI000C830AA4|nr:esterase [Bacillus sp. Marseille-P3661]